MGLANAILISKWSIAEGAACCHATTMDVEEFFDLGAAFGLQTRTITASEGEWASETGKLLFYKVCFDCFDLCLPLTSVTSSIIVQKRASDSDLEKLLQTGKRR